MLYSLIVLLLVLQAGGLLLFYSGAHMAHKYHMEHARAREGGKWETIVIPLTDYRLAGSPTGEITVNGKMYDIKHARTHGQRVTLVAIHDTGEENLLRRIMSILGSTGPTGEIPGHILALTKATYLLPATQGPLPLLPQPIRATFYTRHISLTSCTGAVVYPPPRVV